MYGLTPLCVFSRFTLDDITLKKSIPYVRELTNSSSSSLNPLTVQG